MENNSSVKIYVGFIAYNGGTAKYLPYFLFSLKNQTFKDFKILAIDNSEVADNDNAKYVKNNFPEVNLKWAGKNLGFAKAFNLMIAQAIGGGADYFLVLNPDMILEPNLIEELVKAMKSDEKIAAAQPKILKWDFEKNIKTNLVDSYGIICDRKFRFRDKRQGEIDFRALVRPEEVFGFTGAAVLLRLAAMKDVACDDQYFDELMFMYKEDCDLSLRLRLAGWKIVLAPDAVVYHDRTNSRVGDSMWQIIKNRSGKKIKLKQWSFFGQLIIVLKYYRLAFSLKTKFLIFWYQTETLVFAVLFEQYLLKELFRLWRLRAEIKKSREGLKVRIAPKEIEKLMS